MRRGEIFGMPLDAQTKALIWRFDSLDHAVNRPGVDAGPVPCFVHSLVVCAVHLNRFRFQDLAQKRSFRNRDGMARFMLGSFLLMG